MVRQNVRGLSSVGRHGACLRQNTWKVWLDAIENPDWKNTTVALRGINYDTDKIQRRQTAQGEIYGFMSTVLTKNQGSYTRRLRSLTTNRLTNGDFSIGRKFPAVTIASQMLMTRGNHEQRTFFLFIQYRKCQCLYR